MHGGENKMSKDSIALINGHEYKYRWNPNSKQMDYLGPVGNAPTLSEEQFKIAMEQSRVAGFDPSKINRGLEAKLEVREENGKRWMRVKDIEPGFAHDWIHKGVSESGIPVPRRDIYYPVQQASPKVEIWVTTRPTFFMGRVVATYKEDDGNLRVVAMWDGEALQSWIVGMDGWTDSKAFVMPWEPVGQLVTFPQFIEGVTKVEELIETFGQEESS
jgi:hypothetical protein